MKSERLEVVWKLVRKVPRGFVASYGQIGRSLPNRVSGLTVGRWMMHSPEDVPWWRIVGAKGDLLVGKRDVSLAEQQKLHLMQEGVNFNDDNQVLSEYFLPEEALW